MESPHRPHRGASISFWFSQPNQRETRDFRHGHGGHADSLRRRVLPRLRRAPVTIYLHQVRHCVCLEFLNIVVCFLVADDPRSAGTPPFFSRTRTALRQPGARRRLGPSPARASRRRAPVRGEAITVQEPKLANATVPAAAAAGPCENKEIARDQLQQPSYYPSLSPAGSSPDVTVWEGEGDQAVRCVAPQAGQGGMRLDSQFSRCAILNHRHTERILIAETSEPWQKEHLGDITNTTKTTRAVGRGVKRNIDSVHPEEVHPPASERKRQKARERYANMTTDQKAQMNTKRRENYARKMAEIRASKDVPNFQDGPSRSPDRLVDQRLTGTGNMDVAALADTILAIPGTSVLTQQFGVANAAQSSIHYVPTNSSHANVSNNGPSRQGSVIDAVRDAANTPQEIKRSRDRVRYANMFEEAKKEKIIKKNLNRSIAKGGVIASLRNRLLEPEDVNASVQSTVTNICSAPVTRSVSKAAYDSGIWEPDDTAEAREEEDLDYKQPDGVEFEIYEDDDARVCVEHLSIQDGAQNPSRTTRRPRINIDDILAGLDRVDAFLAECIGLAESALRRPRGSAAQAPFRLRSSSSVCLDQIRSSMEKLRLSDLSQPSIDQIGSDMVPGPQAGYQENRQERRNNDGRNPRVPPRRTPATPQNLDDDFVLEYDGQNVFATPSSNLAAAFEMFESNPKTVSEMMVVVNKHADMEDTEKAHRHHKDRRHSDDRLKQRHDDHQRPDGRPPRHNSGKHNDRPESSKQQERKRGPDITVAVADRPRQRTSLNHEELDRLLDDKCPWHKDSNHTARECHALRNSVAQDDPKHPRYDDRDKPGNSKTSRGRGRRNDSPRRDRDNQSDKSPADFQEASQAVNFIYGGSRAPRCRRRLKLDQRKVNSVFQHPVEPLRWSEVAITFDRRDYWIHLSNPGSYPVVKLKKMTLTVMMTSHKKMMMNKIKLRQQLARPLSLSPGSGARRITTGHGSFGSHARGLGANNYSTLFLQLTWLISSRAGRCKTTRKMTYMKTKGLKITLGCRAVR
ncbi:retrotransposon protein, putative, Ty3-gypsy subclass [Panicum miliaceum]|uniref:Retrotransposon protein, putative, Ty3-gypsy subclass n=1 Tax=Panicum miliaceum TaxID=4540 RepID=A0A3L6S1I3_PANMI|nr:retrotransposon protein, putative, Ty3-gypsy subclass [Panicum miliaceum]